MLNLIWALVPADHGDAAYLIRVLTGRLLKLQVTDQRTYQRVTDLPTM